MEKLGIDLYQIGESSVTDGDGDSDQLLLYQILLGVTAMVLGSLVFLLLASLIYRTRK